MKAPQTPSRENVDSVRPAAAAFLPERSDEETERLLSAPPPEDDPDC